MCGSVIVRNCGFWSGESRITAIICVFMILFSMYLLAVSTVKIIYSALSQLQSLLMVNAECGMRACVWRGRAVVVKKVTKRARFARG